MIPRPGRGLTEEGLREFCRGRIAHYKVPRHVRFVAEMPVTATGKPQKFRMREHLMEELGLRPALVTRKVGGRRGPRARGERDSRGRRGRLTLAGLAIMLRS